MKFGDLMQKFFMSNPKRAMWFLSTMPASFWEKKGQQKVLVTFRESAKRVVAYKKLLKEHKIKIEEIKTFTDFQNKVPIFDKKNYISRYQLNHRCLGKLTEMSTVSMSSGSTGVSIFWPRTAGQDLMLPKYFENFYLQNWDIDKKSTLIVVTMALGTWIAGQFVSWATKPIADSSKYSLTLVTPGSDVDNVIKIIKGIGSNYDQILIIGYPSFIIPIIEVGEKENIIWEKLNIKLWVGGEPTSENWRKYIRKKFGAKPDDLSFLANVYGTSDAGGIAYSSPLSSLVMNLASKDKKLNRDLFNDDILPSIAQFNPMSYYIEEAKGEIVINFLSGVPLIRYNIHDRGGVISYNKALEILKNHGYDVKKMLIQKGYSKNKIWKWPFLYTFGRKDNTVSIGGANVYPENIEPVLYRKELRRINSFRLTIETSEKGEMRFAILIELKPGRKVAGKSFANLKKKYHDILLKRLLRVNEDYKDAYENDSKYTDPVINIYGYRQGPFVLDKKRTKPKYI